MREQRTDENGAHPMLTETRILGFTEAEFERLFAHRGIRPEVVEDAFYPYEQESEIPANVVYTGPRDDELIESVVEKYRARSERLAQKSPGMMMVKFPVPEAEQFIFNEQRPEWPIWVGDVSFPSWMGGIPEPHVHGKIFKHPDDRAAHVGRNRHAPVAVFRGTTLDEYRVLAAEEYFGAPNYGGDHFGDDTDEPHVHLRVAKYTFTPNERAWVVDSDSPHDHSEYGTAWGRVGHEMFDHASDGSPVDANHRSWWNDHLQSLKGAGPDDGVAQKMIVTEHEHHLETDVTHYAARLSWHPWQRHERWRRKRVMFVMESSLKEAAMASSGEATVSAASITLWNAPELRRFAENHLLGKVVYCLMDSDWDPQVRRLKDDKVISQGLLLRDTLRRWGVDARAAAPPHPWDAGCTKDHDKHGADEHVGPCNPLGSDDLLEIAVTPRSNLREWLIEKRRGERGRWMDGVERDLEVLTWLSRYTANGRCRLSIRSIARHVQRGLEVPESETLDGELVFEAKVETVRLAVHSLERYGAVIIGGDLRGRGGRGKRKGKLRNKTSRHLRRTRREWTGWIELVPELRSDVRTRPIGPSG